MDVNELLHLPVDEELIIRIYNLTNTNKKILFYDLLSNFKKTFESGTSLYTLHSLMYMIYILQFKFRAQQSTPENLIMTSHFVDLCRGYVSFANSESIQFGADEDSISYVLVAAQEMESLEAHGDNLYFAIEYGFSEIRKVSGDPQILPDVLERQLKEINGRYF
jgi:hypothetical protein